MIFKTKQFHPVFTKIQVINRTTDVLKLITVSKKKNIIVVIFIF